MSFIAANKVYTSTNKTTIVWIETELFFFNRGGCVSCLRACFGARLLLQSYYYLNLSEGTDRVGGQLRGDKECPFSGVTKSGRVWRKVPESGARSVGGKACRLGFCSLCANETGWVGRVRGKGELLLARWARSAGNSAIENLLYHYYYHYFYF